MKILITGAAGFIGSHLSDYLLELGHQIVAVDNLSMGLMSNLAQIIGNENFEFHKLDVRDLDGLKAVATNGNSIDSIVHLAAFKIPRYGNALETLKINSEGATNLLEIARINNCKIVMTSTSDVYGKNPDVPFSEDMNLHLGPSDSPRWAYAASKLFDEHMALASRAEYGFPAAIVRLFGSYGPRHHLSWWGGPQSVFIDKILSGETIPIHGDGNQTRSFTFISDTVAGIAATLLTEASDGEIINIGATREISIVDLARLIHQLTDTSRELELEFIPYEKIAKRYEDVMRRIPDDSKCHRLLGVRAKVSLEDGLIQTIEWQRKIRA